MSEPVAEDLPPSPLRRLPRLSRLLKVDLWVKRDDLLPMSGGGNKVRKAHEIAKEIDADRADVVITNGGVQSNHCRVFALLAAERGWEANLVMHGEAGRIPEGNLLLAMLCGAKIDLVPADEIAGRIEQLEARHRALGRRPFVVPGGGHCRSGALAYYKAALELDAQWGVGDRPDRIVVASGTGATQAGLAVGLDALGWATDLTGVSVARAAARGLSAVAEMYEDLSQHLGLASTRRLDFRDEWTEGGYGVVSDRVLAAIRMAAETEGLVLDPSYTGKAFAALLDMRRRDEVREGERVVFWHTGGLVNLLAAPSIWDRQ